MKARRSLTKERVMAFLVALFFFLYLYAAISGIIDRKVCQSYPNNGMDREECFVSGEPREYP